MKTNRLYAFANISTLPFKFLKNSEGEDYALHYLSAPEAPVFFDTDLLGCKTRLVLKASHLSFYENQDDSNPQLSEYHYTAYFNDTEGNEYQLHVNYDERDHITIQPQLSKLIGGEFKLIKSSEELSDSLLDLANTQSKAPMISLRTLQQKQMQQDAEYLMEMDRGLSDLSKDLKSNQELYFEKIKVAKEFIQSVMNYHYDSQYYLSVLAIFNKISNVLQTKKMSFDYIDKHSQDDIAETPLLAAPTEKEIKEEKPTVEDLSPMIDKALQSYQALEELFKRKHKTSEELTNVFLHSFHLIKEAALLLDEPNYICDVQNLEILRTLVQQNQHIRKQVLEKLLVQFGDLKRAEQLIDSNSEEQLKKLVHLALVTGNAPLLDFLLTHSHFPINTYNIQANVSPMLLCFQKHSEKTSKIECMNILIKHGASLLEDEPSTGLPIFHLIQSNPRHPLTQVIKANTEMLFSHNYLHKVIKQLQKKLLNAPPELKSYLEQHLLLYTQMARAALDTSSPIMQFHKKKILDQFLKMVKVEEKDLDTHKIALISTDALIQTKLEQAVILNQTFQKLLTPLEVQQYNMTRFNFLKTIKDSKKEVPNFEEAKQTMIDFADMQIQILQKRIHLHGVQQDIKKGNSKAQGRKKVPKKMRQLASEQAQLIAEINAMAVEGPVVLEEKNPRAGIHLQDPLKLLQSFFPDLIDNEALEEANSERKKFVSKANSFKRGLPFFPEIKEPLESDEDIPDFEGDFLDFANNSSKPQGN